MEPILRNFELDILANLGYQIDFFNDLESNRERLKIKKIINTVLKVVLGRVMKAMMVKLLLI